MKSVEPIALRSVVRLRRRHLLAAAAVMAFGLASRAYPAFVPAFFGKYPGDVLWALLVVLLIGVLLPRARTTTVVGVALGFAVAIEFLKLSSAPWLLAMRNHPFGALVFGHVF